MGVGRGVTQKHKTCKAAISPKRCKIGTIIRLLLRTNRKSYIAYVLSIMVPKSMTLDDLERRKRSVRL